MERVAPMPRDAEFEVESLKMKSSGNDMHVDGGVLKPGLGPDQPDDLTRKGLLEASIANFERQKRLDAQGAELLRKEAQLGDRESDLDTREAELARQAIDLRRQTEELEAKLAELSKKLEGDVAANDTSERRKSATDRPGS